jgi:type IV pilus assembly protein PilE
MAKENSMHKQRGVTLIELMVVVLIVSILAGIAIPSYNSYIRKSRRVDAKAMLTSMAQQYERCYTRYNKYTSASCAVVIPFTTPRNTYTIAADPAGVPVAGIADQTFALKATPIGDQLKDTPCPALTLNQAGTKGIGVVGATATQIANCW